MCNVSICPTVFQTILLVHLASDFLHNFSLDCILNVYYWPTPIGWLPTIASVPRETIIMYYKTIQRPVKNTANVFLYWKTEIYDFWVYYTLFPRSLGLHCTIKTTLKENIRPTTMYWCLSCSARAAIQWRNLPIYFSFTFSVQAYFSVSLSFRLRILSSPTVHWSSAGDTRRQVGKTNGHRHSRTVSNYRKTSERLSYFIWGKKKILSDLITLSVRFDAFWKEETVVFRENLLWKHVSRRGKSIRLNEL